MRRAKIQSSTVVALAMGVLLASATAIAQTNFGDNLRDREISGSVGIGAGVVPDYEGSDDFEVLPFPILRIGWGGGRYAELIGGTAKVNLLRSETWDVGPMLNFRRGRDDDVEDPSIKLMTEIDDAVELGAFVTWKRNGWNISASALQDVSDEHEGFLFELSGGYSYPVLEQITLSGTLSTTFATDDYMETYFGVNASDSAASGLPMHSADTGIKDVGVTIVGMYRITPNWGLLGSFGYSRLLSDAKDSPVVDIAGDANQFLFAAGFTYSFGKRSKRSIRVKPLSH